MKVSIEDPLKKPQVKCVGVYKTSVNLLKLYLVFLSFYLLIWQFVSPAGKTKHICKQTSSIN